jgi:hypothetical protein
MAKLRNHAAAQHPNFFCAHKRYRNALKRGASELLSRHRSALHISEFVEVPGDGHGGSIRRLGRDRLHRETPAFDQEISLALKRDFHPAMKIVAALRPVHIAEQDVNGANVRREAVERKLQRPLYIRQLLRSDTDISIENMNFHFLNLLLRRFH